MHFLFIFSKFLLNFRYFLTIFSMFLVIFLRFLIVFVNLWSFSAWMIFNDFFRISGQFSFSFQTFFRDFWSMQCTFYPFLFTQFSTIFNDFFFHNFDNFHELFNIFYRFVINVCIFQLKILLVWGFLTISFYILCQFSMIFKDFFHDNGQFTLLSKLLLNFRWFLTNFFIGLIIFTNFSAVFVSLWTVFRTFYPYLLNLDDFQRFYSYFRSIFIYFSLFVSLFLSFF